MKREDIEKLLGGYAAGILTESERRELFEAAIKDQRLFDQLMREEALREMLEDPAARRRLMEASAPASKWFQRRFTWAVAGSLAAALVCGVFMVRLATPPSPPAAKLSMRAPKQDLPQPPPADFPARNVPVQPVRPERVKRKAASVPAEAPAPAAPVQLEEQARKESAPPGAVAESVEVAPTPVPQRDAMASGLSAASIAPEQRILYTIQRRTPEGSFLDLRPGDTLDPNDTVRLSLHARVSGTLNVTTSGGQINPP